MARPIKATLNRDKFLNAYPETMYWFGMLLADGYIKYNKNSTLVALKLKQNDENVIKRFKEYFEIENVDIKYDKRILKGYEKDYYVCGISIGVDKEISDYLSIFGIVPNKSLLEKDFNNHKVLNDETSIRNFIRGYFDGDGGVSVYKKKNGHGDKYTDTISISLLGTNNLLTWINNNLLLYLGIDRITDVRKYSSVHTISWGNHNTTLKFFNWIYKENEFCMNRKYEKIKYFLQIKNLI